MNPPACRVFQTKPGFPSCFVFAASPHRALPRPRRLDDLFSVDSRSVPKFMKRMKVPDYKDRTVFGVPLIVHVQRTGQPLPQSIQQALRYLRSNCLDQVRAETLQADSGLGNAGRSQSRLRSQGTGATQRRRRWCPCGSVFRWARPRPCPAV